MLYIGEEDYKSLPQMGWYQCLVTVVSLLPSYPDIRNFKVPSEFFHISYIHGM